MMLDGNRRILEQEVSKPARLGQTMSRFGQYFQRYWFALLLAFAFIMVATWTQIYGPQIIGQAVDCYLFPTDPALCWFTEISLDATLETRLAGLGQMTLILIGLFILGAATSGLAFYSMRWAGENVLRKMRQDLFRHMHSLSLGYYAKNEMGDVMSRVTNDADTIR
ncbi:MAG: ABC transporter ATP-binding protein, partial [Chloroflexi bacterium]|nr:ABC transporter ATP-binding protein [Chloroflexota bacterium]